MTTTDNKATLILFCGLPGSGKTTLAKQLAKQYHAIRLNTDEWMADLGFDPNEEPLHTNMQLRLWELAKEMLTLGHDVVLEDGLWMKPERDKKRHAAKDLSVGTELHYLKVPLEELIQRLESRNKANQHGHAQVNRSEIEQFYKIFEAPDESELALFSKVIIHEH
jgi:predicted kinase